MNVGKIQEYKIQIDNETYTFRLDFKALIKFNNKFENAIQVFNNYLSEKNQYDCLIKILSCSCVERDFTEEELLNSFSFDLPTMKLLDLIGINMIRGSIVLDNKNKGNKSEKN